MKREFLRVAGLIALMVCLFGQAYGKTTPCSKQGGYCIFMAAALPCPIVVNLSCGSSSHMCCMNNVRSVEDAEPKCQDVGGTCFFIASQFPCFKKLNARCDVENYYCCGSLL